MSYTETDLIVIRSAIAKGELRVQYADRSVEYRSMNELMQAEAHIITELSQSSSATPRPKQAFGVARKGF